MRIRQGTDAPKACPNFSSTDKLSRFTIAPLDTANSISAFVKSDLDLKDNNIAIVSINNNDYTVKRYSKKKKTFIADNPEYPNIEVLDEDTILCLGVVKHLVRDL